MTDLQKALEFHRAGDLDGAEAAYRALLADSADDADALHLLGVLLHKRGNALDAEESIRSALMLDPECAQFHLSLGGVLMQQGRDAEAHAEFERAIELDPNAPEAHALLGYVHARAGDLAAAEDRFRIGRRAEADDPMLLLGLGNLYLAREQPDNALRFLARAAEQKPEDATIQFSLGRAFFEQGNYTFADKAFDNALRLDPGMSQVRLFRGRVCVREKRYADAQAIYEDLLARNEQTFGATAGLGDCARHRGHVLRALKFYRRALALEPDNPGAANACAWCMEQIGDLAGAAEYLAGALQRAPDATWLRTPLSGLLDRLGRGEEAARVRAG
ncbi:MAG: tetratricopeptide repeat protein [Proteobacteria bacterium]|nr:tetratricopeptide repeat protein [Pseudomonadota bacterium]